MVDLVGFQGCLPLTFDLPLRPCDGTSFPVAKLRQVPWVPTVFVAPILSGMSMSQVVGSYGSVEDP